MTTPRYIYDTEEETHRRMQSDPATTSALEAGIKSAQEFPAVDLGSFAEYADESQTIKKWFVKLIEKFKGEAKVFVQDSESVHPWVLIGRLDANQTDERLKEIALQQVQDMWKRG